MLGPSHKETTGSQHRWAEPCRSYRDVQKRVDCAAGGPDLARGEIRDGWRKREKEESELISYLKP
jgi:hypothetical protein